MPVWTPTCDILQKKLSVGLPVGIIKDILEDPDVRFSGREHQTLARNTVGQQRHHKNSYEHDQLRKLKNKNHRLTHKRSQQPKCRLKDLV